MARKSIQLRLDPRQEQQRRKYEMSNACKLNAYTYTASYIALKRPPLTNVTCMHTYYRTQMPG